MVSKKVDWFNLNSFIAGIGIKERKYRRAWGFGGSRIKKGGGLALFKKRAFKMFCGFDVMNCTEKHSSVYFIIKLI